MKSKAFGVYTFFIVASAPTSELGTESGYAARKCCSCFTCDAHCRRAKMEMSGPSASSVVWIPEMTRKRG
jgi:hypothetical protein